MTDQLKAFLIALLCLILMMIVAAYQKGKEIQTATQQQAALSPEQKIRTKIKDITELNYGTTADHREALQLTIRRDLVGTRSAHTELSSQASKDIHTAYQTLPSLQTLDILYEVQLINAYGESNYGPALSLIIDRPTHDRIQWETFDYNKLPTIADTWTPHRDLKQK